LTNTPRRAPAPGQGPRRGAGLNKNTVLRALHILRDEGLLEFRRGRGITVAGTPQRGAVLARTRDLLDFARHHGFGREEIIQIIETLP
jgi:GntR family transcriptional regulator